MGWPETFSFFFLFISFFFLTFFFLPSAAKHRTSYIQTGCVCGEYETETLLINAWEELSASTEGFGYKSATNHVKRTFLQSLDTMDELSFAMRLHTTFKWLLVVFLCVMGQLPVVVCGSCHRHCVCRHGMMECNTNSTLTRFPVLDSPRLMENISEM